MNKVLFVSYHFPPDAAVGALRVRKMAKFLQDNGIEPIVLTVTDNSYERVDPTNMSDVQNIKIHRTTCWRPPLVTLNILRKRIIKLLKDNTPLGKRSSVRAEPGTGNHNSSDSVGLLRKIDNSINNLPDEKIYWIFHALIKGLILTKKHNLKCIISSSPPHSVSVIAYFLSRISGCKLVLDYRDPWTVDYIPSTFESRLSWINKFEQKLERYILDKASLIILNTDNYRKLLANKNIVNYDKLLTVYNGFDYNKIEREEREDPNKIILSHFGTLYLERNPANFFQALDQILSSNPGLSEILEINFYGQSFFDLDQILSNCRCREIVKVHSAIPYHNALSKMAASDILLAFAQNQPYQIPAKLFDYIGSKKTVLLCGTEGASFNLINKLNAGICVSLDDTGQIVKVLEDLIVRRGFRIYENYDNSAFSRNMQLIPFVDKIKELG